jgi:hypothetical protein
MIHYPTVFNSVWRIYLRSGYWIVIEKRKAKRANCHQ